MKDLDRFIVYEGEGIRLEAWSIEKRLELDLDATEPYFMGIVHYDLSEEDTQKMMSLISYDDFAAAFRDGGQEWLERFLEESRIFPRRTYFRSYDIDQRYFEDGAFRCTFYEDDSRFDGHDYEYTFYFDRENTDRLKEILLSDGRYNSLSDWIKKEVSDQESGYDFMGCCEEHGIHGIRRVYEDYPGGVNYIIVF